MERERTLVGVIISAFIVFIAISDKTLVNEYIIRYILVCVILIVIQLASYFSGKYRRIIDLFQIVFSIILITKGMEIVVIAVPSVIYSLLINKYRKISYVSSIAGFLLIINPENIALFLLYSSIIYLYMDSLYKREVSEKDLKNNYKIEREENHKLIEKLAYMDNYRNHTNIMAQINERNYIAQSLHDKLGHSVTSSIMQLQVSKAMIDKDKNLSIEYLNSAIENLSEGMDDIRLILRSLKPQEEIIGIESIKTLLSEFQNNSRICAELKVTGDIATIDSSYWIVIEDNLKEALTNAYKYSNATKIEMYIEVYNKFIRIEIRDNGKGSEKIAKGLGLRGMEERARSIEGTISFLSNNGFSISMIIGL
ncbi:sensor histidine kinase [Clostridium gasigenes]|uniref:sensor histidine kinase n=1 Tax=Clostridium gasigenes TaxID=94869 RepID=UPI001C0E3439|nr:sensor histidine kinase [Clostridium gasigenes]MBU3103495.1 sensor histidine kinase [Clostridium gasigenes]